MRTFISIVSAFGSGVAITAFMVMVAQARPAQSTTCERARFPAKVLRIIDGDTLEVLVELGLNTYRSTAVRLAGIDTPEVFGPKVNRDLVRGSLATKFTQAWVSEHSKTVELFVYGDDKYGGRIDADVYPAGGGQSLSDALREAGHEK